MGSNIISILIDFLNVQTIQQKFLFYSMKIFSGILCLTLFLTLIISTNTMCKVCSKCIDCNQAVLTDDFINDIDALLQSKTNGIGYPFKIQKVTTAKAINYNIQYSSSLRIQIALNLETMEIQLLNYQIVESPTSTPSSTGKSTETSTTVTTSTSSGPQTVNSQSTSTTSTMTSNTASSVIATSQPSTVTSFGTFMKANLQKTQDGYSIIQNYYEQPEIIAMFRYLKELFNDRLSLFRLDGVQYTNNIGILLRFKFKVLNEVNLPIDVYLQYITTNTYQFLQTKYPFDLKMNFTTIDNQNILDNPWISSIHEILLKQNGAEIGALPKLVSLAKSEPYYQLVYQRDNQRLTFNILYDYFQNKIMQKQLEIVESVVVRNQNEVKINRSINSASQTTSSSSNPSITSTTTTTTTTNTTPSSSLSAQVQSTRTAGTGSSGVSSESTLRSSSESTGSGSSQSTVSSSSSSESTLRSSSESTGSGSSQSTVSSSSSNSIDSNLVKVPRIETDNPSSLTTSRANEKSSTSSTSSTSSSSSSSSSPSSSPAKQLTGTQASSLNTQDMTKDITPQQISSIILFLSNLGQSYSNTQIRYVQKFLSQSQIYFKIGFMIKTIGNFDLKSKSIVYEYLLTSRSNRFNIINTSYVDLKPPKYQQLGSQQIRIDANIKDIARFLLNQQYPFLSTNSKVKSIFRDIPYYKFIFISLDSIEITVDVLYFANKTINVLSVTSQTYSKGGNQTSSQSTILINNQQNESTNQQQSKIEAIENATVITYSGITYNIVQSSFYSQTYIKQYLQFLESSDASYARKYLNGIYTTNNDQGKSLLFRFKDGGKYNYINTNAKQIINLVNVYNGNNQNNNKQALEAQQIQETQRKQAQDRRKAQQALQNQQAFQVQQKKEADDRRKVQQALEVQQALQAQQRKEAEDRRKVQQALETQQAFEVQQRKETEDKRKALQVLEAQQRKEADDRRIAQQAFEAQQAFQTQQRKEAQDRKAQQVLQAQQRKEADDRRIAQQAFQEQQRKEAEDRRKAQLALQAQLALDAQQKKQAEDRKKTQEAQTNANNLNLVQIFQVKQIQNKQEISKMPINNSSKQNIQSSSSQSNQTIFSQQNSTKKQNIQQTNIILSRLDMNCMCYENGICLKCAPRFYLSSNVCIQVAQQCLSYDIKTGQCFTCISGFNLQQGVCITDNVYAYYYENNCISCPQNHRLVNRRCISAQNNDKRSPQYVYAKNPLCFNWQSGKCVECLPGTFLTARNVCEVIDPFCLIFDFRGEICNTCEEDYSLTNGKCFK